MHARGRERPGSHLGVDITMTEQNDTYTRFMETLDTINSALDEHGDKPVFKQMLEGADKALAGRKFGVAVYKENPKEPHDYFTLRFNNRKFELDSRGKDAPDIDWKVSTDYLQDVSGNPDKYIKNPLLLDVDWIKSRLAA